MENVKGSYAEVELADGRMGNYRVAQQYYRDFDRLRIESPEKFNRICDCVLGEKQRGWDSGEKQILGAVGLAFDTAATQYPLGADRSEQEVREFIKLAVKPTIASRMFGILVSDTPDYDLHSPFKNHVPLEPDLVSKEDQRLVATDWQGEKLKDYPGSKLVPNPAAKAPAPKHDNMNPIMF